MAAALAAALLAPVAAAAQALAVGAAAAGAGARVEVVFSPAPNDLLERTLRDGLESRITFTLRLYEERRGLAAVFGDALLDERTVSRVAFYDALSGRFVVEEDGDAAAYRDGAALAGGFFRLGGLVLGDGDVEPAGRAAAGRDGAGRPAARYVAARVQYDPVRLSPPLTILSLFGVAGRVTTAWVRRDVPAAASSPGGAALEAAP